MQYCDNKKMLRALDEVITYIQWQFSDDLFAEIRHNTHHVLSLALPLLYKLIPDQTQTI